VGCTVNSRELIATELKEVKKPPFVNLSKTLNDLDYHKLLPIVEGR
jgi:hypothetical protein